MKHPKDNSAKTLTAFSSLIPEANIDIYRSTATIRGRTLRIKRALMLANQVQVWRGEPLVVHVPEGKGRWYVIPVSWQLKHAMQSGARRQHGNHPYDCMMVPVSQIPSSLEVQPHDLRTACSLALEDAVRLIPVLDHIAEARRRVTEEFLAEAFG